MFVVGFFIYGWIFILNDPSYKDSIRFINSNKLIAEKMGVIKEIHYSPYSKLSYSWINHVSHSIAKYKFGIIGDKSNGTLFLEMEGNAGIWVIKKAQLELSDKSLVDLTP